MKQGFDWFKQLYSLDGFLEHSVVPLVGKVSTSIFQGVPGTFGGSYLPKILFEMETATATGGTQSWRSRQLVNWLIKLRLAAFGILLMNHESMNND